MPRSRQKGGRIPLSPGPVGPAAFTDASPYGRIAGHGCPGTSSKVVAAKGTYSAGRWQKGGTSVVCMNKDPLSGHGKVIGTKAGHAGVSSCPNKLVDSSTSMRGGRRPYGRSRRGRRTRRSRRRSRRSQVGAYQASVAPGFRKGRSRRARRRRQRTRRRRATRRWRGGAHRTGSNVPVSYGYSLGGTLGANSSALASPPPYAVYDHCKPGALPIPKAR